MSNLRSHKNSSSHVQRHSEGDAAGVVLFADPPWSRRVLEGYAQSHAAVAACCVRACVSVCSWRVRCCSMNRTTYALRIAASERTATSRSMKWSLRFSRTRILCAYICCCPLLPPPAARNAATAPALFCFVLFLPRTFAFTAVWNAFPFLHYHGLMFPQVWPGAGMHPARGHCANRPKASSAVRAAEGMRMLWADAMPRAGTRTHLGVCRPLPICFARGFPCLVASLRTETLLPSMWPRAAMGEACSLICCTGLQGMLVGR